MEKEISGNEHARISTRGVIVVVTEALKPSQEFPNIHTYDGRNNYDLYLLITMLKQLVFSDQEIQTILNKIDEQIRIIK